MTKLATHIERAGITQTHIAETLGVSHPTVSDWVRGVKRPRPERVPALAKVLGIDASALYLDLYAPRKNRR